MKQKEEFSFRSIFGMVVTTVYNGSQTLVYFWFRTLDSVLTYALTY